MTRPSGQPEGAGGEGSGGGGIDRVIEVAPAETLETRGKAPSSAAAEPAAPSPSEQGEGGEGWMETDAELMGRVRSGDSAAFAALYERHKGWVVAVAFRFCGDRELALDVLQETFAFLLRRSATLTLDGRLTTYLFPAVKNLSQTARRKKMRMGGGEVVERHGERGSGTGVTQDEDLARVLAGLPEAQRELIYMRYVAGMMPTEIAVVLGVPVGTAKSRLFSAVRAVEMGLKRSNAV
jgi:RNA polymerase sigma factor (sigma-70 family)